MPEPKTTCLECGVEFLQATADSNGGYCLKCRPNKKAETDHEEVAEKIVLSLRLLFAIVFAFVFAVLGYGAGAVIWFGVGVILVLVGFPIGFVYGFFMREINSFIRAMFRGLFHFE